MFNQTVLNFRSQSAAQKPDSNTAIKFCSCHVNFNITNIRCGDMPLNQNNDNDSNL